MKVAFTEVWAFLRMMKGEEQTWRFRLVAGNFSWEAVSFELVKQLENDINFDRELLPNLFTFREIFWQPNVYPTLNACLTGLKLVTNYGQELKEEYSSANGETRQLYLELVEFIGKLAQNAHEALLASEQPNEQLPSVLGEFRKQSFPLIMLLTQHPMNLANQREDAMRRINFMVKTLLDQYQLRFNDLLLPYWQVERVKEKSGDQIDGDVSGEKETESPT